MTDIERIFRYKQYQQAPKYLIILLCKDCRDCLQLSDQQWVTIQKVCDICGTTENVKWTLNKENQ